MILVIHNILWSKYKGAVFSSLNKIAEESNCEISFVHLALTDSNRIGLSLVDKEYHKYKYEIFIDGVMPHGFSATIIIKFYKLFRKIKPNFIIIPGFNRLEFWVFLLISKLYLKNTGLFCDSTIYDNPNYLIKYFLKCVFVYFIDVFFCYGQRSKEYLLHLGVPENKILIRCQSCALPDYYSPEYVLNSRMFYFNLDNSKWKYIYIGRLSGEKCVDLLLNSFSRVLKIIPYATLTIVGSGPLQQDLFELSCNLNIAEYVFFTGAMEQEEISMLLMKSNCLVLPSNSEPWGLVVNESLSYGCPVIVSDVCGCVPELVAKSDSGLVFESNNIDDLTEKMILSIDKFSNAVETAKSCLKLISNFSPKIAAEQIFSGVIKFL